MAAISFNPFRRDAITSLGLRDAPTDLELRSPVDNPAIPLNSPAVWDYFYGGEPTASGEQITEANALQITTVYAAVRIIAESVASLPLKLMERTANGHEEAVDAALHYLLAVEPNPEMSAYTFKECLTGCLALTGNAYAQIERSAAGQPVALWPLHPLRTEPVRLPDGTLAFKTSDGMAAGQYRVIPAEDTIHVALWSMDGIRGISPIAMARQSLGLTKAAEKFGARFFGNGTRAGAVLTTKTIPDPKTRQELKESWEHQQGGVNQGKTALLFGDWSYQSIGLSPDECQFLSTRNFQRSEVAALFRIAPHFLGDTSRLSGNNAEQEALTFVTHTLRPYLNRFEAEFVRKLMPTLGRKAGKYFVQFDVADLLKVDFKTQQEGFAAGRTWGWYSANDVRRKLGENPGGKELDVYLVPVNMVAADRLLDTESTLEQPLNTPAPTPAERNLLGAYTRSFLTVYKDAFGRLSKRNKRDSATIDALFRPVLRSIADTALAENGVTERFDGDPADGYITDVVQAMTKRAAKWAETLPAEEIDALMASEFTKAIRSIHINITREIAAAKAAGQLEETTHE
jgi:HK97 family phage portal protein